MNRVELHPEGLLERARRRIASPEELERLRAHLVNCKVCTFEHAINADCDRASAPRPDDDLVLARLRERTLRALAAHSHERRSRHVSRRVLTVATAAAVLLVAACAAGAIFVHFLRSHAAERTTLLQSSVSRTTRREASVPLPLPSATSEQSPGSLAEAEPLEAPSAERQSMAAERPPRNAARSARASSERTSPADSTTTAADLFARANAARRAGDVNEAAHLYRDLQRTFPGTVEELVSRVTLGRLLLDRLGDASGALILFDGYLANPSHRGLREEALIGRALALGRLRRLTEERAAWTALLAAYPTSAYAERARARLAALR
jgi:TolA-binding protein